MTLYDRSYYRSFLPTYQMIGIISISNVVGTTSPDMDHSLFLLVIALM